MYTIKTYVSGRQRRANHVRSEIAVCEDMLERARRNRWPDHAKVPVLKNRARLRRELEWLEPVATGNKDGSVSVSDA